jgi:hypothetical protein
VGISCNISNTLETKHKTANRDQVTKKARIWKMWGRCQERECSNGFGSVRKSYVDGSLFAAPNR